MLDILSIILYCCFSMASGNVQYLIIAVLFYIAHILNSIHKDLKEKNND